MEYLLRKISNLNSVGILRFNKAGDKSQIYHYEEHPEFNPLSTDTDLRENIFKESMMRDIPYLYRDRFGIFFAGIRKGEFVYMAGPMSLKLLDRLELHQYYRFYEMKAETEKALAVFTMGEMLDIVEILSNILTQREYTDDDLIYANNIITATIEQEEQEQIILDMKENEELYHHTYQEERKLLDSIREGRSEDALRYSRNMDANIGKLSGRELNQWKNLSIVAITLCTRAAIDGGISPAAAYRISDFYIQKSDGCSDIAQIIKYRDNAVSELAYQVEKLQTRRSSSYVERCKDYINKNYKKKIYLSDMAEQLNISETYLSRLFKKETGRRIQDFIVDVRLERAANLLKYSEQSISHIAEYVNFPSQSYMGKVFKEKYAVTPKQYREKYKPTEFIEKEIEEKERAKKG